jgi:hypothetical protein
VVTQAPQAGVVVPPPVMVEPGMMVEPAAMVKRVTAGTSVCDGSPMEPRRSVRSHELCVSRLGGSGRPRYARAHVGFVAC